MKSYRSIIVVLFTAVLFSGCAATQTAVEKRHLKVQTKMSNTIFLDLEHQEERTVYVSIRNTSDRFFDLTRHIEERIRSHGYTVIDDPTEAFYILQANVLYVGMDDPSALEDSLYAGWGGPVLGGVIGGAASNSAGGAIVGGVIGAGAEIIIGSMVKDVTYSIITDVQVTEKTLEKVVQTTDSKLEQGKDSTLTQTSTTTVKRKKYQTRIMSTANKANLEIEEAIPFLTEGLIRSISGIF